MKAAAGECQTLRVVVGPTAAGKSALAMQLAEHYNLAIVSADSRQVYRQFDIGTAKPSAEEQSRIPHFGIDILSPTERYSAHQWAHDAGQWCADSERSGRSPLIVGGTGFYVRALVQPFDEAPVIDAARRLALAPVLDAMTGPELERWCHRLDPMRAGLGKTQHLRAIETVLLSGVKLSDAHGAASPPRPSRPARYLVVDPGPALHARIEARVQAMLNAGWVREVRQLLDCVPRNAPAWKASGYLVLRDAVEGTMAMTEAFERVLIETRQYAKRQRTWNRHQLPADRVTMIDPTAADAFDRACAWWETDDRSLT